MTALGAADYDEDGTLVPAGVPARQGFGGASGRPVKYTLAARSQAWPVASRPYRLPPSPTLPVRPLSSVTRAGRRSKGSPPAGAFTSGHVVTRLVTKSPRS